MNIAIDAMNVRFAIIVFNVKKNVINVNVAIDVMIANSFDANFANSFDVSNIKIKESRKTKTKTNFDFFA